MTAVTWMTRPALAAHSNAGVSRQFQATVLPPSKFTPTLTRLRTRCRDGRGGRSIARGLCHQQQLVRAVVCHHAVDRGAAPAAGGYCARALQGQPPDLSPAGELL